MGDSSSLCMAQLTGCHRNPSPRRQAKVTDLHHEIQQLKREMNLPVHLVIGLL